MAESSLTRSRSDPPAFGQFYREHALAITRYFARRVLDAEAALDLTAETFAQAYAGRGAFRGRTEGEARAWLYTIAHRQLAGYLQRGYADRAALTRLGLERPAADSEELARVEELGDMTDLWARVAQQMDELPPDYRETVRLRVVEELPYPLIAQRLDITETAARMRVSRSLRRLRTALAHARPATAAIVAAVVVGACATPATRGAVDHVSSALTSWIGGNESASPGRPVTAGEKLPAWVAAEAGEKRVLAEAGGEKLVAIRHGEKLTLALDDFGDTASVDDWRRVLRGRQIRLVGAGRFLPNGRHNLRTVFGVVSTTVRRVQFDYADGHAPATTDDVTQGAFGLVIETNRRPRSVTAYDRAGNLVARVTFIADPHDLVPGRPETLLGDFRYCPDAARGCPPWPRTG